MKRISLTLLAAIATLASCSRLEKVSEYQSDYPRTITINGVEYKASSFDLGGDRNITVVYPVNDTTNGIPVQMSTTYIEGKQTKVETTVIVD